MFFLFVLSLGGVKSFASDSPSVLKWCLNRADQAKNVKEMKDMAGTTTKSEMYKALRPSQILTSEKMVTKVIEVLQEEYINPFSVLVDEGQLYNLSSGVPVSIDLADEILETRNKGIEIAEKFTTERLLGDGTKKFHDPLPRNKIKAFKNISKTLVLKKSHKERKVEVNRDILALLVRLSLTSGLPVDFNKALEYPLSPIPLSIATPDGERRETVKSKLMEIIISTCRRPPQSPKSVIRVNKQKPSALVIDLIAAIRTMTEIPETYHELTWKLLGSLPKGYKRVDLVADTYREVSIKNGERQKRGTSARLMINSSSSKVPRNFVTFMKNGENKMRLIELICQVIEENGGKALHLLKCNQIYFSKENYCSLIDEDGSQEVEHLKSNQEEADTKVVLHCLDALRTPEATVVLRSHSGDTDIMVLAVTLIRDHCERLFVDYGSGKHRKALRLSEINMSDKEKDALLGFHAFTGNDYISAFFMKGKAMSWKCMLKKEDFVQLFADLGATFELEQQALILLEEFVCHLYGYKCMSLNTVRSKLFNKKVSQRKKAPDISLLPPCHSVFRLHATRALYVAKMWRSTPVAWIDMPEITNFSWDNDGTPIWIEDAFPDDVTELLISNETEINESDEEEDSDDGEDDEEEKDEDQDDVFFLK